MGNEVIDIYTREYADILRVQTLVELGSMVNRLKEANQMIEHVLDQATDSLNRMQICDDILNNGGKIL